MVRDQALALSGLLSREVGGPSVFPPQPEGLWQAAFNGQRTWTTSKGDDLHRRGLYTFWRRTIPYPSMAAFDAPSREICTIRRIANEHAAAGVRHPERPGLRRGRAGPGAADRPRRGLDRRGPHPVRPLALPLPSARPRSRSTILTELLEQRTRTTTARTSRRPANLATEPLGPLPEGMDPAELAAWTTVANMLLNLDGVLTKG